MPTIPKHSSTSILVGATLLGACTSTSPATSGGLEFVDQDRPYFSVGDCDRQRMLAGAVCRATRVTSQSWR
jgi:hypothetical protein